MTVRPIIFSAPMIRALLSCSKTMTRRIIKPQPGELDRVFQMEDGSWHQSASDGTHMSPLTVRFATGDLLYVREAYASDDGKTAFYRADGETYNALLPWHPSIHMPRWASRLTLEVTAVKIERLKDISEADARAEGADELPVETGRLDVNGNPEEIGSFRLGFCQLWESLHGLGAWADHPWVCAISFAMHRKNIAALLAERGAA